MKTIQIISVVLTLLLCQYTKAQVSFEGSYKQLTFKEYTALTESDSKNKLNGKYYVREFKDKKLIGIHKIEYKKGKKYGEWLHFSISTENETLDLSTVENYDYDLREGYYYNSEKDFTFIEEGNYERGIKEGIWNVTKLNSKEKINYKYGKKHGEYMREDASGNIIIGEYKKDTETGDWTIKDPSGNIKPYGQKVTEDTTQNSIKSEIRTIQGTIHKPTGSIAPIAVVRLQLSDSSCSYAFSDFEGKFSMEIDMNKISPTSYFEIVIEGFPMKKLSFSSFSDKGIISLDNNGEKVSYQEYRNYYESMKDCNL